MKICVLVKEVPDAAVQKRIDASTGRMDRSGEKNLNPYDTHAIEAAMQIKEGGNVEVEEIVAVTMGPESAVRALRDAGMEVIYTGLHQTPEQIVETVIQEDADAVGLSILSGAHMTLVPRIVELLREQGIDDVLLTVGGTIPGDDIPELKRLGVAEVFTPGASTQEIIDFIQGAVGERERM